MGSALLSVFATTSPPSAAFVPPQPVWFSGGDVHAIYHASASSRWNSFQKGSTNTAFACAVSFMAFAASVRGRRKPQKKTPLHADNGSGNKKNFRMEFLSSENYVRFGKTQLDKATENLKALCGSELIDEIRKNGFRLTVGDITFVLAESYGFCWGVERAVAMAHEARNFFPDKRIWASTRIIHNPTVNAALIDIGVKFLDQTPEGTKDFSVLEKGDVVILPAFGATVEEMALLTGLGVHIIDTTCPWVSKVWRSVERNEAKGFTSIIHGKVGHEETIGTKSFASKYIIVRNMEEADFLANFILGNVDRASFLDRFSLAMSPDFDPDKDLERVGVANQTTMLKGESQLIGKLMERVMIRKYGPQNINDHFISFNTICDATQERQDAMYKMIDGQYVAPGSEVYEELAKQQPGVELLSETKQRRLDSKKIENQTRGTPSISQSPYSKIDLCLVVGGYDSSNTSHLAEIAEEVDVPTYHIDGPGSIGGMCGTLKNQIWYKPVTAAPHDALAMKEGFLPDGPVVVGVTSGASTPDSIVGDCLNRLLQLHL